MRAIILLSSLLIADALYSQHGARKQEDKSGGFAFIILVAFIWAICLDLNE